MASIWGAGRWKSALLCLLLTIGFGAGLVAHLYLMQAAHGSAVIRIPSAFLAAGLLLLPGYWRHACFAACGLAGVGVWALAQLPLHQLINFGIYTTEALFVVLLAKRFTRGLWLNSLGRIARLWGMVVLPAAIATSTILTTVGVISQGWAPWTSFGRALTADLLGMGIILPSLLVIGAPARDQGQRRPIAESVIAVGAFATFGGACQYFWNYTPTVILLPALIAIAFRYGAKVTVSGSLAAIALIVPIAIFETVGLSTGQGIGDVERIQLQLLTAGLCFMGLAVSLAISEQKRLRALLVRQTSAAKQARAEAIAASRAKTDFLATMSHEIRTPMNGILGFTQLVLRQDDLPQTARERLERVDRAGGALVSIVNDILDFSKVEAGEITLAPRPTELAAIARDCLAIVEQTAAAKGLTVSLDTEGDVLAAHEVDDQRLRQVLLNLLNNAIKFTQQGGVSVRLAIAPGEPLDRIRFEVRDTGVGMSPEGVARLFRRYAQADALVSRNHGGTGLGLAISKGFVELMGGAIGVDSDLGKGSTFWFEIPLLRCEASGEPDAEDQGSAPLMAHVLLVDDHPMNRELGVAVLTMLGCTVDTANDGGEAIEAVKTARYDLILMDVNMPVMDGLEATRAICALPGPQAQTPIIAMSADVLPEQVARALAAGMVDAIPKPIRIETLYETLAKWVGSKREEENAAAA